MNPDPIIKGYHRNYYHYKYNCIPHLGTVHQSLTILKVFNETLWRTPELN